ncbi:MAG TPA: hypothetical protein VFC07_08935 [Verrucomicrobiae bacterium]|nr:hypothetical protein [Verrucomicrobiae bacterium]
MRHAAFLLLVSLLPCIGGPSTIDSGSKYAYGANLGWVNCFSDGTNGAVIGEYVCSGYIYSANVGWICLGNGSPANGIQYQNNSASDFGVNLDPLGNLSGYAYGANIGWVAFESNGAPRVSLSTGVFAGSAWAANCGWISLSNATAYVQTDAVQQGALAPDGLPVAWLLSNFGTTNIDASADPDHDGMSNLQEYLAGTDPNNGDDVLKITSFSISPVTASGGQPTVGWKSTPSRFYYLQKASNLGASNWVDSGFGLLTADGASTARSFADTNYPNSFYRVQAVRPLLR